MGWETFIGLRYLKAKKRTTSISVITSISVVGVMLGVATLAAVLGVMSGFKNELLNKVLGAHSHGVVTKFALGFKNYREMGRKLKALPGVTGAAPFVFHEVMITAGSHVAGVGIKGIDPAIKDCQGALREGRREGSLKALAPRLPGDPGGIAIGTELSRKLRVGIGDSVNVISPLGGGYTSGRFVSRSRVFRVAYIFHYGMFEQDSKLAYIHLKQAQSLFDLAGSVSGIEFQVKDILNVGRIKLLMYKELGGWPYRVRDWRQMHRNLFTALQLNKVVLFLILLFIVLVASFNIVGTLVLMVLEKGKEIGIMRAMGATSGSVTKVFMTYGLYIGALGTTMGLLLALLFSLVAMGYGFKLDPKIYYIHELPLEISLVEYALVGACSLLVSFMATVYPALQASKEKPVEVMRYE